MAGKNDILVSSLFGVVVAEKIPRFALIENEISKHVLPVVPFLGGKLTTIDTTIQNAPASPAMEAFKQRPIPFSSQFFPLMFRLKDSTDNWFTFPYEPLISISGRNNIVKKTTAKVSNFVGTVKERFSQDDYEITITGILMGETLSGNAEQCFPRADFMKLVDYCRSGAIEVRCEPMQLLGINYIVIEDFSFPFTKGENVQAYELKCLSDFTPEILLEIE